MLKNNQYFIFTYSYLCIFSRPICPPQLGTEVFPVSFSNVDIIILH